MIVQLDTNVLIRLTQPSHPHHATALGTRRIIESRGHDLCIVPQNLFEFWAVATRPIQDNGLGLTISEANADLGLLKNAFVLHRDLPGLLEEWEKLVVRYECRGKPTHDARIVAAMNLHGVKHLLTFNGKDFARYSEVTVLDPPALQTESGVSSL